MVLSPRICYVCGGPGASQTLYSRSITSGAYFPFLESHEAPKGVRPPTKDGTVDSCNICFAFLHQQWESYEKNHTPLVKRLYWLKRLDNRPFTGAEMRMQGEYAAQVMGLQYYPSNTGTMSPYEYSPISSSQAKSGTKAGSSERCSPAPSADNTQGPDDYEEDENGALDLSLTSSTSRDDSVLADQRSKMSTETFQCHACKNVHSGSNKRVLFSKCRKSGEPYFSFLSQTAKSTKRIEYDVCKGCKDSLFEQWSIFEYKKLPEHMRNYCIQNNPVFKTSSSSSKPQSEATTGATSDSFSSNSGGNEEDICYICGQLYGKVSMKMLNTKPPHDKSSKHSMFFPFIAELKRHPGARPIDRHGRVVSCRACYSYLQRQWQGYQQENTSSRDRKYVLRPLTEKEVETSIDTSIDTSLMKQEVVDVSTGSRGQKSKDSDTKVTAPLNIEINTSSSKAMTSKSGESMMFPSISNAPEGLLAIAPHISPQMMMSAMYHPGQIFYSGVQGMYNLPPHSKAESVSQGADTRLSATVKQEVMEETGNEAEKRTTKSATRGEQEQVTQDMKAPTSCGSYSQMQGEPPQYALPGNNRRCESRGSSVYSEVSDGNSVMSQRASPSGLGSKPPPLTMTPSSLPRTTVTVPPLNPVSPGSSITSTASSLSAPGAGARQNQGNASGNSFAAALRKLAKQAEGPESSPLEQQQHNTGGSDSSATSPRENNNLEVTSKRSGSGSHTPAAMNYSSSHHPASHHHHHHSGHHPLGVVPSASCQPPPVVTIAPTPALNTYMGSERKTSERRTPTNAMLDPLGIKPERDKMTPSSHDRREEERPHSKDSAPLPARMTPHPSMPSVSSASSLHEDLTRGFQPYRTGEEALRHSALAAAAMPGIDPAAYPAAYAQAAAAAALAAGYHQSSGYGAHLRMDDPLLLERYRLMQSSLGYAYHPSFLTPVSQYLGGAGGRHPAELLSQMGYPYLPPGAKLPEHLSPGAAERLQSEEEAARREREAQREREKELERREKEERERVEKEMREREDKEREKERMLIKEAEHRAGSGGNYGDRHLATAGMGTGYPHEPLNLKRGSSSSGGGGGGGSLTEEEHSRAAAAAALHRQLNGDRAESERHLAGYRPEFPRSDVASLSASSRGGLPTLGVPPMSSLSKPQNLASHGPSNSSSKDSRSAAETHPTFHRPFEISGGAGGGANATKSRSGGGNGGTSGSHGLMPSANGYDRDSYLEYERKLLAEREKMLAEHRASQEKAQQQRTGSSGSHGTHGASSGSSHGDGSNSGSSSNNKDRASYSSDNTGRLVGDNRDLKSSSSSHSMDSSSASSGSKHSLYRSPHKSLLPSNSSAGNSKSSSHSHPQQHHHPYLYGKEGGKEHLSLNTSLPNNKQHQQPPAASSHHHHHQHHNIHGDSSGKSSSHYPSALTNLQNYSKSKVSSGFSSSLHSGEAAASISEDHRSGKTGINTSQSSSSSTSSPRVNGAYQSNSHTRSSHHSTSTNGEALLSPTSDRKKESLSSTQPGMMSSSHQYPPHLHPSHRSSSNSSSSAPTTTGHSRPNNVRSPKKIRQLLGGTVLAKDKLEEGEPPLKKPHLTLSVEGGGGDTDLPALPPEEELRQRDPDYRRKARFLFSLQLEPVPPERRKELEFKQKVCEWDQIRRCKMLENPPAPCSVDTVSLPYQYTGSKLTQLVTTCVAEERSKQMSSSLELAGLATTTLPAAPSGTTPITRPSLPPPPSSSSPLPPSGSLPLPPSGGTAPPLSRSVIYPAPGSNTPAAIEGGNKPPPLSQDFAYEFHESVLQETRQQRAQKANQQEKSHQDVRYTLISDASPLSSQFSRKPGQSVQHQAAESPQHSGHLPSSLQSIQNMTSQLLTDQQQPLPATQHPLTSQRKAMTSPPSSQHKGMTSPHSGSQLSLTDSWGEELRWPGVEAIMMAYQRHMEEVSTERQILTDQSHKLLSHHRDLSTQAEELSARMTDLLQNKRQAEEERTRCQAQLDAIRQQLQALK